MGAADQPHSRVIRHRRSHGCKANDWDAPAARGRSFFEAGECPPNRLPGGITLLAVENVGGRGVTGAVDIDDHRGIGREVEQPIGIPVGGAVGHERWLSRWWRDLGVTEGVRILSHGAARGNARRTP